MGISEAIRRSQGYSWIGAIRVYSRIATDWRMSSNGGDYTEWRTFRHIGNGRYTIRHYSSSDFGMCPICGRYTEEAECCKCEPDTIGVWHLRLLMRESGWEFCSNYDVPQWEAGA